MGLTMMLAKAVYSSGVVVCCVGAALVINNYVLSSPHFGRRSYKTLVIYICTRKSIHECSLHSVTS